MGSHPEEEIRASVGARRDLGPGYDDVVAEGLVERIGAEIDKRIDERLRQRGFAAAAGGPAAVTGTLPATPGYQGFSGQSGYQWPGYPGYQGYQAPARPPAATQVPAPDQPPAALAGRPGPAGPAQRSVATTITALGSMALGVGATAVVSSHFSSSGAQAFLVLVIWIAIAVINVAHARHR